MKKIVFLALTVLFLSAVESKANPVDEATARKVAATFMQSCGITVEPSDLTDLTASTPFTEFYVFTLSNAGGFVLVAGDDNTEPILGYAIRNRFDAANIPPHVMSWLQNYETEIAHNRSHPAASKSARDQWNQLQEGHVAMCKASVDPMLTTTWSQSPYYNNLCPYDTANDGRAVAGCTATATGQIMKYFGYPTTGYGSCTYTHKRLGVLSADYGNTTYKWDSMPTALNGSSSEAQVEAVATLLYHIGVAVSMDYSANGSGGKTASYGNGGEPSSENAFKYNFKYSPYVWTAFICDYDLAGWKQLMKDELNAGRPILYAGYDKKQDGHAFIVDGYNSYGLFHLNWGWGGNFDGNYKINNLNPSQGNNNSGYHFDYFSTATVGIEPYPGFNTDGTTTVVTNVEGIRGASQSDGTVTGAGSYNFGDTITMLAQATNDHTRFVQWSDGCRYNPRVTVATGGNVEFTAQFAPLWGDTLGYFTSGNAMNRAGNVNPGLGTDSVWGIKLPASVLRRHHDLTAVQFMGKRPEQHTLTIYTGTDSPSEVLYTSTFIDSVSYTYSWYTHELSEPVIIDGEHPIWIALKCTVADTHGVFSLYGGNNNGLLSGDNLTTMNDTCTFSWMINAIFTWDGVEGIDSPDGEFGQQLKVYPNPTSGDVTIELDDMAERSTVQIHDLNGRLVFERSNEQRAVVKGLQPGVYVVKVNSGSSVAVRRLVVRP